MAEKPADNLDSALQAEETRLIAARDAAFEAARVKPTQVNRKALRKATAALEEFLRAAAEPVDAEPTFAALPAVLEHLQASGWKIAESTLYEHRDQAKIKAGPDGRYTLAGVTDYARRHLRRLDGTAGSDVDENLGEKKLRAEIDRIRHDADLRELKLRTERGELVPLNIVESAHAERAINLRNYLDAVARSSAGRIIKLVGGDPQKAPALIGFMLGMNRKAMDNYSRPIQGLEDEEE